MREFENIKKDFENQIEQNTALIEAWQKVNRVYKKDGSSFAVLSRNFENVSLYEENYSYKGELVAHVYTHCNCSGYIHDELRCYDYAENNKSLSEDRIIKPTSYTRAFYTFNADEIEIAIANRIAYLQDRNEALAEMIAMLPEKEKELSAIMETLNNMLNSISGKGYKDDARYISLRYAIEMVVHKAYFA